MERGWQLAFLLVTNWFRLMICTEDSFTGHLLFRVVPANVKQLEVLQKLHYHPPDNLRHLDFWSEPSEPGDNVYIRVDPERQRALERFMRRFNFAHEIIVNDIQRVLDEHAQNNLATRLDENVSIYESYLTFDEVMEWLKKSARLCGDRCSLEVIGRSFEGRNLTLIKVSSGSSTTPDSKKPAIWIDAGIHAREWIGPATALYFIDRLINDYESDSEIREIADKYDWYILPVVNPDGYEYSHVRNRLWRKTRSITVENGACIGIDANRNFGFHWRSVGFRNDPCSDIYAGEKPFSEPETKAHADYILSKNGTWRVFLTLHSYGQLWMAPYGYTTDRPKHYDELMLAANAASRAIEKVYGTQYKTGSASNILYRSSGTSRDWAAGVPEIPFVYTVELRDSGEFGFLLPPKQILPTGIETWEGVKALLRQINQIAPWLR